jgi:fumarate reductase subunit C
MKEELNMVIKNQTWWQLVPRSENMNVRGEKWV